MEKAYIGTEELAEHWGISIQTARELAKVRNIRKQSGIDKDLWLIKDVVTFDDIQKPIELNPTTPVITPVNQIEWDKIKSGESANAAKAVELEQKEEALKLRETELAQKETLAQSIYTQKQDILDKAEKEGLQIIETAKINAEKYYTEQKQIADKYLEEIKRKEDYYSNKDWDETIKKANKIIAILTSNQPKYKEWEEAYIERNNLLNDCNYVIKKGIKKFKE